MRIGSGTAAVIAITLIAAGSVHGDSLGPGQTGLSAGLRQFVQQAEPLTPPERPAAPAEPPAQENRPSAAPSTPAATPPGTSPTGTPAVVLDDQEVSGIVGKSVRSNADEDMGRIVDIIVNQDGHVRAAIIDFGGFLGIGTRKIAVDWRVLKFSPAGKPGGITLELTRNQVRVAPEYKRGEPLVVLGPAGPERTTPSTDAATPER
ncbi:MAG TPA: PRC-barrel domain-containing protein [Xanthobacteraceae bacterium]|nr:PRC-barrel domain-containing protein [Xanthobacteraceae bacterium]